MTRPGSMSIAPPIELDWAKIVHDLRGPLMPLSTAAWLLRNEEGISERVGELTTIVERQSRRLTQMMDELSDWGRSGDSQFALNLVPVDAALAVDMAICGIAGCHVVPLITDEAAAFQLGADQHRLGQLLRALIEHAIFRDPDRLPEVSLSVESGQLHIRIRDQGAPLDAMAREALLSQSLSSPFDDGLGLRLLLARRIAEAHGGSLTIDATTADGLAMVCALPRSHLPIPPMA